jgi:hypothetical protein
MSELVERARRLEEEGRRIAFERDKPIGDEVLEWFGGLDPTIYNLTRLFNEVAGEVEWGGFVEQIGIAALGLRYEAMRCRRSGMKLGECIVGLHVIREMKDLDRAYKKASGRERCTWLLGVKEPYTLSAAINDLTACLHRAAEKAEEHLGEWKWEGKCIWRK